MALEFHPAAEIFPLIDGEDFNALVEDIRKQGLINEIWLHPDGSILDGRNRYRACLEAGIEPRFKTWDGEGFAADFVWSLNDRRRHLDGNQRKLAAARYAVELEREAKDRQGTRTDLTLASNEAEVAFGKSAEHAAEKFNESRATVERAVKVVKEGSDELIKAVERGDVSVSAAADVATLPKEEQQEIVAAGPAAVRNAAVEIRHHRSQFTGNNEWYTPAQYIELARECLGTIDVDPASNEFAQERVRASVFYTEETDGLSKEWVGNVWLNPPYAQPAISNFIDKMVDEWESGRVSAAIMLTHNYTDTAWFQKAARFAVAICFTRGRVRFEGPNGEVAAPTQGQAFFYFGDKPDRFHEVFSDVGFIAEVL